jgi:hypothetical protein
VGAEKKGFTKVCKLLRIARLRIFFFLSTKKRLRLVDLFVKAGFKFSGKPLSK